jgi:hypothetical protein
MQVSKQTPIRIELDKHVRKTCVVQHSSPQRTLSSRLNCGTMMSGTAPRNDEFRPRLEPSVLDGWHQINPGPEASGPSTMKKDPSWGQGFAAMRYNRFAVARYSASPTSAGRE